MIIKLPNSHSILSADSASQVSALWTKEVPLVIQAFGLNLLPRRTMPQGGALTIAAGPAIALRDVDRRRWLVEHGSRRPRAPRAVRPNFNR